LGILCLVSVPCGAIQHPGWRKPWQMTIFGQDNLLSPQMKRPQRGRNLQSLSSAYLNVQTFTQNSPGGTATSPQGSTNSGCSPPSGLELFPAPRSEFTGVEYTRLTAACLSAKCATCDVNKGDSSVSRKVDRALFWPRMHIGSRYVLSWLALGREVTSKLRPTGAESEGHEGRVSTPASALLCQRATVPACPIGRRGEGRLWGRRAVGAYRLLLVDRHQQNRAAGML
jgi:hypothetical protein